MPSERNLLVEFGLRRCRAALVLMVGALAGCSDSATPRIIGGGATSIEPLVNTWQPAYFAEHGVQVDFIGPGSGNGVQQMICSTFMFGCPMSPYPADLV